MEEFKFKGIGRHRQEGAWHMARQSHSAWEMIVISSGAEEALLDGARRERFFAGDLIIFRPGQSHEEWSLPEFGALDSFFLSCDWSGFEGPLPLSVKDVKGRLRLLAQWLNDERVDGAEGAARQRELFFEAFLIEVKRLARRSPGGLLEESRARMKTRLDARWTLESLARSAGMSKFHFLRKYKEASGLTPMEELRSIRAHAARDMILTSRLPLKSIADICGLGGETGLSRTFKRVFGCAPGSLRK